jgi:hypothetical protein
MRSDEERIRMLAFSLSVLLGAVLGARFRVGILFPVTAAALAIVAADATMQGAGIWAAVVGAAIVLTGLQVGFLAGAATYFLLRPLHVDPSPQDGAASRRWVA